MTNHDMRKKVAEIYCEIIGSFDQHARALVREGVRNAVVRQELKWSPEDFSRIPERFKGMDEAKAQAIYGYTVDQLFSDLGSKRIEAGTAAERVVQKIVALRESERAKPAHIEDALPIVTSLFRLHGEINYPFATMTGAFAGYRRSAHAGDIVHYFVRITRTTSFLVRLEAGLRRNGFRWWTDGFGFAVGHKLFLIGNAHDGKGHASTRSL